MPTDAGRQGQDAPNLAVCQPCAATTRTLCRMRSRPLGVGEREREREEGTGGAFLLIVAIAVVYIVSNCALERGLSQAAGAAHRSASHRIAWYRSKHADSKIPVSSPTGEADALSRPPARAIGRTREEKRGGGALLSLELRKETLLDDPLTVDIVHVGPGPGSPGLLSPWLAHHLASNVPWG